MLRFLFTIFLLGGGALDAATNASLPAPPPNWKLEVVASAPKIRHPSVVACAPDGRVFVAEDPMDISAPSANLAQGRILCFHPDGRVTVFADNLYAVFGMQYLRGKLYVMHNPKFSLFTDDNGVGRDRVDLIESTNPNPWALDWNDHVPANFRLAMDGFLYLATGDKGIYGAVGRDGNRVDLHGGGILRLRPDGTGLEVFSTGVRNIMDAALNAEDEVFTYDNTDEQQWMSRLTHMVEGGFYGYPYDFIPRRPYTLWMMADYGGGAATGTLAYNEDALPVEFRGNLFLADFGKRQVLRLRVERDGATYKVSEREDMFRDVPEDFRPVGIALAPEGLSLYLCDWNHRDTKEKVEVGRLLKLTYTGESKSAPKPDWYLPIALGKPFRAGTTELIQGLSHPAQSVRLAAQQGLVDTAKPDDSPQWKETVAALTQLLEDHLAPSLARMHAIWALDAIDTGRASRAAIITVLNDRDPAVASQAMRQLGTRRVLEAAEPLAAQLRHPNALMRFHAATALGRIANPATMPSLQDALNEKDSFARFAVFTALNRLGRTHPQSWSAIAEGLENSNPAIREGTAFALRETYDPLLVSALSITARDRARPSTARATALQLLAVLHRKAPEWRGEWWAYHPVNSPPPAKSVAWAATPSILSVLRQQLFDPDVTVRRAAALALRETADPASAGVLRELLATEEDVGLRCAIVETLGDLRDRDAIPPVALLLNTPGQNRAVLASAVAAAGRIGSTEFCTALTHLPAQVGDNPQLLSRVITVLGTLKCPQAVAVVAAQVRHSDDAVRQAAFQSLARIRGPAAIEALVGLLHDPSPELRRSAVAALGACKSLDAVAPLLQMYQDEGMRPDAIAALALMPDARAVDAYLDGLGGKNASSRDACRKAITAIRSQALPDIEKRLGQLSPAVIGELKKIYRDDPSARQGALFTSLARMPELADYSAFVIKNTGDPLRGKAVFIDPSGVGCAKCHTVGGQGGNVGPDLSSIGAQFSQAELIESVLYPSKSVREGYQQFTIETKDGEEWSGLLRTETNEELTLQEGNGALQRIRKTDLKSRRGSSLSLMPEGLHAGLSLQEFADLIAYLESLKGQGSERRNP